MASSHSISSSSSSSPSSPAAAGDVLRRFEGGTSSKSSLSASLSELSSSLSFSSSRSFLFSAASLMRFAGASAASKTLALPRFAGCLLFLCGVTSGDCDCWRLRDT
ncbi:hypothetical protein KC338_g202 [Hortaea werneckii]|nr:hypothetical protein KC338_g202 [Hortaea werneckii]